jgi:glycosyltransferase involved in cell wall biosynthesis
MRILLITAYPRAGCDAQGGVEVSSQVLARALAQKPDTHVCVLCLDRSGVADRWSDGAVSVEHVPYRERAGWTRDYPAACGIVRNAVAERRPDVVHAMGAGPEATAATSLSGPARVVTPHGDVRRDVLLNGGAGPRRAVEAWVRGRAALKALGRCDACVAVGDPSANLAAFARRVVSIPNAVRPSFLTTPTGTGERHGVFVPAAVKRIKRIERILRAGSACGTPKTPVPVRIAGRVEDEAYMGELLRIANGLEGVTVSWLGPIGPARMVSEYDRARVAVLASDWEVAPISVAEAMCRGCAVVAPRLPGLLQMTDEGRMGLLSVPGDDASLRECLLASLVADTQAEVRVSEARTFALERFDPAAVAGRHLALYAELMSGDASGLVSAG